MSKSRMNPNSHSAKVNKLIRLYGDKCFYCNIKLTGPCKKKGSKQIKTTRTLDHIIPISEGGDNAIENLLLACYDCNQKRKSKEFYTFLAENKLIEKFSKDKLPKDKDERLS